MKPRLFQIVYIFASISSPLAVLAAGPASSTPASAPAPQNATGLVDEEYRLTQEEFRRTLIEHKRQIRDLSEQYRKAIEASHKQGAQIGKWIEDLKRYDILLTARYVDEKGEPQPSLPISDRDRDNINTLCATYLQEIKPLSGRVSLSSARKTLEVSIDRLQERRKAALDPTEKNNSELEIIARQRSDTLKRAEKTLEIAKRTGLNIEQDPASARVPASR